MSSSSAHSDGPATVIDGPSGSVRIDSSAQSDELAPELSQGRYVVLETIGRGGMGRVLRAYDPKLQREVALKVVRTELASEESRDRLLREARAMARLSHPNVVAVYDAEESDEGVVLVMEYVAGQSLRQWSKAGAHDWTEVVAHFIQAGRGLAAAHDVEILHRDFKPANVLVSESGEVKVTDFGLAKLASATGARQWDLMSSSRDSVDDLYELSTDDSLSGTLTRADTVVGTPRYMAPEQHRREPLGPAADQYAFCVALWEVLTGTPVFKVRAFPALQSYKQKGPPDWPPGTAVPKAIVAAIRRGLSPETADRWPSMRALLAALQFDPARRRRRLLTLAGGVGLAGAFGFGWQSWATVQAARCSGAAEQLDGVWDEARRQQAHAAVTGIDAPYAERAWEVTEAGLSDYAQEWIAMHERACEATTLRGEQSAAVMDLRMACLHRAKLGLDATVGVLLDGDPEVVRRAHQLVASLRPLSRCADVTALFADVEPPLPEEASAVEQIRAHLAEGSAEHSAGRYERAQQQADAARALVAEVEYAPIHTDVTLLEGAVLERLGRYDESQARFEDALRMASAGRQWEQQRQAANQLMYVVGAQQDRFEEALRYRALAEGLCMGDPQHETTFRNNLALIYNGQGKYAEAEAEHRTVLEIRERTLGASHPLTTVTRNNLGVALKLQGKFEDAEAIHRRTLQIREQTLGPDHPDVAASLANLGTTLTAQGRHDDAEQAFTQALAIWEVSLGPDHPDTSSLRGNLGIIFYEKGEYGQAERQFRRMLAEQTARLGPEHPTVGAARNNLAVALRAQNKYAEAEAEYRETLEHWTDSLGPDHPNVSGTHNNLANLLLQQERFAEAEQEIRRAIAAWEKSLEPGHQTMATAKNNLGRILFESGRANEALEQLEQAWVRRQRDDIVPAERAETAFLLARVLWETSDAPKVRARARALADEAAQLFEDSGSVYAGNLRHVQQWLDQHR